MTALVLLSGGLDSATLLASTARKQNVRTLAVNYGQRHARELNAATWLADYYGAAHTELALGERVLAGSALTGTPSASVVVPNRNAVLVSVATSYALAHGCDSVNVAMQADDSNVFPDCRAPFVNALGEAVRLATGDAVALLTPFLYLTKREVAQLAHEYDVPVARTWSCYTAGPVHCGRCKACAGRRDALGDNDPTRYLP